MDDTEKKKMLFLVEGAKRDIRVITKLFESYSELDMKYKIVPYCTNIHVLYQEFFEKEGASDELYLLFTSSIKVKRKKF